MINEPLLSNKSIIIRVSVILFTVLMINAISIGNSYFALKKESDANYQKGIEAFSNNQWNNAIDYLSKVGTTSGKNYDDAVSKIQTALNNSKAELAAKAQDKAEAEAQANAKIAAETTAPIQVQTSSVNTQAGEEYAAQINSSFQQIRGYMSILAQLIGNYRPTQQWKDQVDQASVLAAAIAQKTSMINPPPGYEKAKSLYLDGTNDLIRSLDDTNKGISQSDTENMKNSLNRADMELGRAVNEFNSALAEVNKLNKLN